MNFTAQATKLFALIMFRVRLTLMGTEFRTKVKRRRESTTARDEIPLKLELSNDIIDKITFVKFPRITLFRVCL